MLTHFVHLLLYFSFPVHGGGKREIHVVRVVLADVNVLQRLPIDTITNWLSCGPEGRKWIKPLVVTEYLLDVSTSSDVPFALELSTFLLKIFNRSFIL